MNFRNNTRHQDFDDILTYLCQHLFIRLQLSLLRVVSRLDKLIMLCRNHNGIDTNRTAVVIIFYSHLALRVRTQVSHHLTFTADFSQYHQQLMCQVERQRHIVFSFIGSVAEHHTLVAGTLIHRVLTFHSTVNVRALFVNSREYATRVTFEHILTLGITNLVDYLTSYTLKIDIRFGFHFSCQYHLSGSHQRFASYF